MITVDGIFVRLSEASASFDLQADSLVYPMDVVDGTPDDDDLLGTDGNDTLNGLAGNDTLDGGAGDDSMIGGSGDDLYRVDSSGDEVVEADNEGSDTVESSITYELPDNVENLVLTGTSNIDGTGNDLGNEITGNSGDNELNGLGGNDLLRGQSGDDKLIGGTGRDTMIGGAGDDRYEVDHVNDVVTEAADEGYDEVRTTVSFTLGDNIEDLRLVGDANIGGTGNALDNEMQGNSGNNTLRGNAGNDTLKGSSGDDTMEGGAGNDLYYVEDEGDVVFEANNEGQSLLGAGNSPDAGAGSNLDTVISQINYTLTQNVEILTLAAAAGDLDGQGNELPNLLQGNEGDNLLRGLGANDTLEGGLGNDTLQGGTGDDSMTGGAGNDTYAVNSTGDRLLEFADDGIDTVQSSITWTLADNFENLEITGDSNANGFGNDVENVLTGDGSNNSMRGYRGADTLSGGAGRDILRGDKGTDSLDGGDGNDVLMGGGGNDTMTGGIGSDAFVFNTALSANQNVDRIADFEVATDTIRLDDDIFVALRGQSALNAGQFTKGAGLTGAQDATDRIIYDTSSGALYYDQDGTGNAYSAIKFAVLAGSPDNLSASDFEVVG